MARERNYAAEYERRRRSLRRRVESPAEAERRRERQRERYAATTHTLRVSGHGAASILVECRTCGASWLRRPLANVSDLAATQTEHRRSVRGS